MSESLENGAAQPPKPEWKRWNSQSVLTWVSAAAAVVSIFVAIWIANRQQPVKRLTYETISSGPIADVSDTVGGRLRVSFDGKPVPNANFAILRLTNDGNLPVQAEDFKTPFRFHFGKDQKATVLEATVTAATPKDLAPALIKENQNVVLQPLLMNPGESITLKVLLAGGDQMYGASGRIVGTQLVRQDTLPPVTAGMADQVFVLSLIAMVFLNLLVFYLHGRNKAIRGELQKAYNDYKQLAEAVDRVTSKIEASNARADELLNVSGQPVTPPTSERVVTPEVPQQRVLQNGTKSA